MKYNHKYRALFSARFTLLFLASIAGKNNSALSQHSRKTVKALCTLPVDHYVTRVAYEHYRDLMAHADFQIKQMNHWNLLCANFSSGKPIPRENCC